MLSKKLEFLFFIFDLCLSKFFFLSCKREWLCQLSLFMSVSQLNTLRAKFQNGFLKLSVHLITRGKHNVGFWGRSGQSNSRNKERTTFKPGLVWNKQRLKVIKNQIRSFLEGWGKWALLVSSKSWQDGIKTRSSNSKHFISWYTSFNIYYDKRGLSYVQRDQIPWV